MEVAQYIKNLRIKNHQESKPSTSSVVRIRGWEASKLLAAVASSVLGIRVEHRPDVRGPRAQARCQRLAFSLSTVNCFAAMSMVVSGVVGDPSLPSESRLDPRRTGPSPIAPRERGCPILAPFPESESAAGNPLPRALRIAEAAPRRRLQAAPRRRCLQTPAFFQHAASAPRCAGHETLCLGSIRVASGNKRLDLGPSTTWAFRRLRRLGVTVVDCADKSGLRAHGLGLKSRWHSSPPRRSLTGIASVVTVVREIMSSARALQVPRLRPDVRVRVAALRNVRNQT